MENEQKTGSGDTILECENLTKEYTSGLIRTKTVLAAKDATFDIKRGEIVALAGESGSGKSTVARMILRLIEPTYGNITLNGIDIQSYRIREYYKQVQAVFQDPYSAFNPFYKVDHIIDRAWGLREDDLDKDERREVVESTFSSIGLNPDE
ncbi:MAG: ATP-binding cassette domain-containing protein, partial [Candidatus Thorarchaeota archaeon]